MITTTEALESVLATMPLFSSESVPASAATGRVLRQTIRAERDQPPFDRVMMDGIAFSWSDFDRGLRKFPVQAVQAAGDNTLCLDSGNCIEIMTGASLPENADCIVPVEHIEIADGIAEIAAHYEVEVRRFIHPRGSDFAKGAHLLKPGKRVSPLDIAIIASCGETDVDVTIDPVVRVVSTGNELVPSGQAVKPHQIRLSNGPALVAMLVSHGYQRCQHDHIVDDIDVLRQQLAEHLDQASVVVISGGVSMGRADYVPQVLAELGVEVIFHGISQRPGKPMWFGKGPKDQVVFALPGNPVSALVCCRQYVIPALGKASGASETSPEIASLASNFSFAPELTCFQPVKLISSAAGRLLALPVQANTSGDFASLSSTDGYIELAQNQTDFPSGTPVFLHRWNMHQ